MAERFESSLDTVLAYRDRGFDSATTFFVFLVLHTGLADPNRQTDRQIYIYINFFLPRVQVCDQLALIFRPEN